MLIYFAFFDLSRATVIQLLLTVTYHVYLSLRWHHDVLLLHHVVIVLKLLREGIMRIYIGEELLQLFDLQLQCSGGFEVLTFNCFTLALIQHIQITSNKL